ncbi:MAG TPA: pyridoxal phosphate-dependent aminotransferase, partial [Desulfotomaculum sp.]|nr:pyridoxal phosphate-dependent aminotransferase [Desulfotomaculum sp.]
MNKREGRGEKINPVVQSIPPSGIRRFFDLATETKEVISLGVGEPDFVTPWHIREACFYSLEKGYTMYTSNQGLLSLRQAIAQEIYNKFGVSYNPKDELLITSGVSEGLDLAIRATVCPGDEVIVPEPAYVSYVPCITLAGGRPVALSTTMEQGFCPTVEQLGRLITSRTKLLILNYPNNPTGAVISKKRLQEIAAVVCEADLLVISDEIYSKLTYQGEHTCTAALKGMKERTILLNGFSKAYAMTGWRIGYACGPEEIIQRMLFMHQYLVMCVNTTAQDAATVALQVGQEYVQEMVAEYDRRRHYIHQRIKDMGLPVVMPRGAFYIFPDITQTGLTSMEFAEQFLQQEKVAVVPGSAFGKGG